MCGKEVGSYDNAVSKGDTSEKRSFLLVAGKIVKEPYYRGGLGIKLMTELNKVLQGVTLKIPEGERELVVEGDQS